MYEDEGTRGGVGAEAARCGNGGKGTGLLCVVPVGKQ